MRDGSRQLRLVLLRPLALAAVLLLAFAPAHGETLRGRVVGVTDGDTIRLLVDGKRQYKVRLGEIDAPESGQPFGRKSKAMLSDLVFRQTVSARVTDVDRYGRSVAVITLQGTNINAEMVRRGGAWAYRRYLSDQRYLTWEAQARKGRRGLWALQADQIMAPWDWRAARRAGSVAAPNSRPTSPPYLYVKSDRSPSSAGKCGSKRYCRQMNSCQEAIYFLKQCGLGRLDGDGDGVPCESLC
jgi:endonuclease YncB( thermonuclease family)